VEIRHVGSIWSVNRAEWLNRSIATDVSTQRLHKGEGQDSTNNHIRCEHNDRQGDTGNESTCDGS